MTGAREDLYHTSVINAGLRDLKLFLQVFLMGRVATIFKLLPKSADVDIDKVIVDIKSKVDVEDIKIEPIAFGLKAVKVMVVAEDAEGGTDDVERLLSEVDGVSEVTEESSTLI